MLKLFIFMNFMFGVELSFISKCDQQKNLTPKLLKSNTNPKILS